MLRVRGFGALVIMTSMTSVTIPNTTIVSNRFDKKRDKDTAVMPYASARSLPPGDVGMKL
jgi:hypothetical protein